MQKLQQYKKEILNQLRQKVSDKILEESNYKFLEKIISKAETNQEMNAIATMGTTFNKTGIVYEQRLEKMGEDIKYLALDKEMSFISSDDQNVHKLIIGDNYDALLNLQINYFNKINIIYIDPPYGSNDLGEFAKTNYENNISRPNLLSMLHPRLLVAKNLLSDDGVLFCSIDDKNQAYVKCLLDDIFGESAFRGCLPRTTTTKGKNDSNGFAQRHDYILIYSNNEELEGQDTTANRYNKNDDDGMGPYHTNNYVTAPKGIQYSKSLDFEYELDGMIYKPILSSGERYCWRWGKARMDAAQKLGIIYGKNGLIYQKQYLDYEFEQKTNKLIKKEKKMATSSLYFVDFKYSNTMATEELKSLMISFKYPKPTSMIKELIKLVPFNEDAIILDFFAGSGTTGHAVAELNFEDNGKRKFILCTNNEVDEKMHPNGIAKDVTYERLSKVMLGKSSKGENGFDWIGKFKNNPLGGSLKTFNIEKIKNNSEKVFDVIDESNYDIAEKMNINKKVDWVCNNFEVTSKVLK
ncbi:site-specific DNA-methyltransferase [Spiroplasma endosymbiont of Othius punctulatus]|uniref:site-specific DNA-methyltransferase n=1 Tax=Spiroplasma endosymbiont of Othius punctulatus TaxID=3066289 RepID=UPI0030D1E866